MTNKEIIAFYRSRMSKAMPGWAVTLLWPLLLVILVGAAIIALLLGLYDKLVSLFSSKEHPLQEPSVLYLRGTKLVVGYDGNDTEAVEIIKKVKAQHKHGIEYYDWNNLADKKPEGIRDLPSPERDIVEALYEINDRHAMITPLYAEEKTPTKVFVVELYKYDSDFVTAIPRLDDWDDPEEILGIDVFMDDIQKSLSQSVA